MFPALRFERWRKDVFARLMVGMLAMMPAMGGSKDGTLEFYWVDSEGGGSTLVVTPTGESLLVDSGNPGARDPARIHRVAREVAGLERIDHLIVTHFHIDHFGGAAELSALIPIVTVWDNGLPEEDPDGNRPSTWPLTSRPYREMRVGNRRLVKAGTEIPLKAGATALSLRCVMSRQTAWDAPAEIRRKPSEAAAPALKDPDRSDNANSSAWVLSFGDFRFYTGGDLTWNTEAKLIWPEVLVPEVDLYQVVHHGLDVSNHPKLVKALNPTVSVMNNGPTKGTMGEVMATLRALPQLRAQFQVHKNLRPDGATNNCADEFIANLDRECSGHYVRCVVAPGGMKYTLYARPGAVGKTYETRAKPDRARTGAR